MWYNACRHVVWGHYVLWEGEKKKVYMKMRAGLQSQCTHLTWRGWGGQRRMGARSSVLPSLSNCATQNGPAERHRSPTGGQRTLPINTHIMLLWQSLKSKTRLYSKSCWHVSNRPMPWICASRGARANVYSAHTVWIDCHTELNTLVTMICPMKSINCNFCRHLQWIILWIWGLKC